MVASTRIKHRWDTRDYADISDVRYVCASLRVTFSDGTQVSVAIADLAEYGIANHEWPEARSETHHVAVPTRHGDVEIPWDVIRALTDQEFATFLVNHAAASARLVGARLRDLRRQRAMEQPELARFVGVPVETIDRLESGELDVDFDLEERILGALGVTRDEAFA